jgi:hypothetical protein
MYMYWYSMDSRVCPQSQEKQQMTKNKYKLDERGTGNVREGGSAGAPLLPSEFRKEKKKENIWKNQKRPVYRFVLTLCSIIRILYMILYVSTQQQ